MCRCKLAVIYHVQSDVAKSSERSVQVFSDEKSKIFKLEGDESAHKLIDTNTHAAWIDEWLARLKLKWPRGNRSASAEIAEISNRQIYKSRYITATTYNLIL